MLKIGNLKLLLPFVVAPMSGVSDYPFRVLNRKFGCELAFVEMINARALGYNSKITQRMLYTTKTDRPLGVQLLGQEENYLLRALDILQKYQFDILDFNAACPAKKVTSRGEGASLLKEPRKLNRLLKLLVKNSNVPVTVKIRTGWNKDFKKTSQIARFCEDAGIKALFIHGRSKIEEYSANVDYKTIKEVKAALRIPVIASGNIFSAPLAKKMFDETGSDAVAVARGALGNPWIFKELTQFFKNGKIIKQPSLDELIKTMLKHLDLCIDFHGQKRAILLFRKFFIWYTVGFHHIRPLREKACAAKIKCDMLNIIEEFRSSQVKRRPQRS